MFDRFFKKEKTISEIEDDTEHLEAENRKAEQEMSLEKRRLITAQLKKRGLEVSKFQGNSIVDKYQATIRWLKSH